MGQPFGSHMLWSECLLLGSLLRIKWKSVLSLFFYFNPILSSIHHAMLHPQKITRTWLLVLFLSNQLSFLSRNTTIPLISFTDSVPVYVAHDLFWIQNYSVQTFEPSLLLPKAQRKDTVPWTWSSHKSHIRYMLLIHYQLTINKLRAHVDPIFFWNLSLEHGSFQVHYVTFPKSLAKGVDTNDPPDIYDSILLQPCFRKLHGPCSAPLWFC